MRTINNRRLSSHVAIRRLLSIDQYSLKSRYLIENKHNYLLQAVDMRPKLPVENLSRESLKRIPL